MAEDSKTNEGSGHEETTSGYLASVGARGAKYVADFFVQNLRKEFFDALRGIEIELPTLRATLEGVRDAVRGVADGVDAVVARVRKLEEDSIRLDGAVSRLNEIAGDEKRRLQTAEAEVAVLANELTRLRTQRDDDRRIVEEAHKTSQAAFRELVWLQGYMQGLGVRSPVDRDAVRMTSELDGGPPRLPFGSQGNVGGAKSQG